MKSNAAPKLGVIDALTSGLTMVGQRPWLLIVPVAIDLVLWLAPKLSISVLAQKFLVVWEALVRTTYSPAQLSAAGDMVSMVREAVTQLGSDANLLQAITGHWLGPTSALVNVQSTRQTFVSDVLLAPLGLSLNLPQVSSAPWQPAPVEIASVWTALLILVVCWLIGQLLVALYYIQCSKPLLASRGVTALSRTKLQPVLATPEEQSASPVAEVGPPADATQLPKALPSGGNVDAPADDLRPTSHPDRRTAGQPAGLFGFLSLALQLTVFSVFLGLAVLLLRLPLAAAILLMVFSGNAGAGILFALVGGITLWALLWFLVSMYFASEAILVDGQSIWRGALQSLVMIRGQGLSAFGLILMINLLLFGFRAIWGLIGSTPAGAIVAILGNAFLTTSMLLAIFVYYGEIRRRWLARQAQGFGSLARRNQPRDR